MLPTQWINADVYLDFLKAHLKRHLPQRDRGQKILLICDGHKCHVAPGIKAFCIENNIILFVMPPDTSHMLQPLDVSCFSSLKKNYNKEVSNLALQTYPLKSSYTKTCR